MTSSPLTPSISASPPPSSPRAAGASDLIWLQARQLDGKTAGLPLPGYTEFRRAFPRARPFGGGPSTHPAEVLDEAMRACDVVIVSNPRKAVTHHGNANAILGQLHAARRTPRLFNGVIADLEAFRQQVEAQALEESVRIQAAEQKRSRRFEHAAAVAAIAFAVPRASFRGTDTAGTASHLRHPHDIPAWAVIVIRLGALLTGGTTPDPSSGAGTPTGQ